MITTESTTTKYHNTISRVDLTKGSQRSEICYTISRWIMNSHLKPRIAEIKKLYQNNKVNIKNNNNNNNNNNNDNNNNSSTQSSANYFSIVSLTSLFGLLGPDTSVAEAQARSVDVSDYWEKENITANETHAIDPQSLRAVLIIQVAFKMWLVLKRLRDFWKLNAIDQIMIVQAAARRCLARLHCHELDVIKTNNELQFHKFIKKLKNNKEGLEVVMFSKAYDIPSKRKLFLDSSFSKIVYKAGRFNQREIVLCNIYKISRGFSNYHYIKAASEHPNWCFHLSLLGDRVIDMEASSIEETRELIACFERIRLLFSSQAPFYIDAEGYPRRAGPSIMKNALCESGVGENGYVSAADQMRFESARVALEHEYAEWEVHEQAQQKLHALHHAKLTRMTSSSSNINNNNNNVGNNNPLSSSSSSSSSFPTEHDIIQNTFEVIRQRVIQQSSRLADGFRINSKSIRRSRGLSSSSSMNIGSHVDNNNNNNNNNSHAINVRLGRKT